MQRLQRLVVSLLFLVILISLLRLLLPRLQALPATPSPGEGQVVATLPATSPPATVSPGLTVPPPETATPIETLTVDPFVLTLTAYPTFPETPTPTTDEPKPGPTATITPTPSKIVNLADGVPEEEIMVYIIRRADGTNEKYFIPMALLPGDETYKQVRDQLLNLGPEDVLLNSFGLKPPQKVPPAWTPPEPTFTPVPQ